MYNDLILKVESAKAELPHWSLNLLLVVLVFSAVVMMFLMLPMIIQGRAEAFQSSRRTSRSTLAVSVCLWGALTLALLHSVWFSGCLAVNTAFQSEVISYPGIEVARLDAQLFVAETVGGMYSSNAEGIAIALLLPAMIVCPSLYVISIGFALHRRRRLVRWLERGERQEVRCDDALKRIWRLACPPPRVSIYKSSELRPQAFFFPLSRKRYIAVPSALLDMSDGDLLGVLAHEVNHLERDAVLLWVAQALSSLSLTGNGFLYSAVDTHELEFAADVRAVSEMGGDGSAAGRYCEVIDAIYDSLSKGPGSWVNPAGAIASKSEIPSLSFSRSMRMMLELLFYAETPYVHPTRDRRKEEVRRRFNANANEVAVGVVEDLAVSDLILIDQCECRWNGAQISVRSQPDPETLWMTVSIRVLLNDKEVLSTKGEWEVRGEKEVEFSYEGVAHGMRLRYEEFEDGGFPFVLTVDEVLVAQGVVRVEKVYAMCVSGFILVGIVVVIAFLLVFMVL